MYRVNVLVGMVLTQFFSLGMGRELGKDQIFGATCHDLILLGPYVQWYLNMVAMQQVIQ